jgi:chemotaxis response regulator CheB
MTVPIDPDVRKLVQRSKGLARLSHDLARASRTAVEQSSVRIETSRQLLANGQYAPMLEGWDIVVIGGSAGSSAPLKRIIEKLPSPCRVAVFIVQHTSPNYWQIEGEVGALARWTSLPTGFARNEQPIEPGHIYLCPSDQHLELVGGYMRLEQSPRENLTRPSIDVLFRSAAATYGRKVIGILLSGALRDGVAGLWQIKRRGGLTMVQDPEDAQFGNMPQEAVANVDIDFKLAKVALAEKVADLLSQSSRMEQTNAARPVSVMIAEDEGLVALNMGEQLRRLGYRIACIVKTGEEAVRQAAQTMPQVLLMDIRLAGEMNGVQAARRIWEQLQIPVIFVTGNADLSTLNEVKTAHNYGYVMKPFQTGAIHAAIELAIDRRAKELLHGRL